MCVCVCARARVCAAGAAVGFFQGDVRKLVTEDIPMLKPTLMAGEREGGREGGRESGRGGGRAGIFCVQALACC